MPLGSQPPPLKSPCCPPSVTGMPPPPLHPTISLSTQDCFFHPLIDPSIPISRRAVVPVAGGKESSALPARRLTAACAAPALPSGPCSCLAATYFPLPWSPNSSPLYFRFRAWCMLDLSVQGLHGLQRPQKQAGRREPPDTSTFATLVHLG